jgi:tetratricopeptide (TPR) repeat protein
MQTKVPLAKQETDWLAIIPRILLMAVLCLLVYRFDHRLFVFYGLFLYLAITIPLKRLLLPASLYESVKLIKQENFEDAIPFIQEDVDYFTKKAWIDKFRFLLMISSSKRTFREMSLCNMAYCLLQIGNVKESKALYEEILIQYPENIIAKAGLNNINIISSHIIKAN